MVRATATAGLPWGNDRVERGCRLAGFTAGLSGLPVTLRGAVLHAQRLLNVEGYPVLRVDADGATVILDEVLLREQFGIRG